MVIRFRTIRGVNTQVAASRLARDVGRLRHARTPVNASISPLFTPKTRSVTIVRRPFIYLVVIDSLAFVSLECR